MCTTAQKDENTSPFTPLGCQVGTRGLGEDCGVGNITWAVCSQPSSACAYSPGDGVGIRGNELRQCRCVHGTIGMDSGICLPAPDNILEEEIHLHLGSNATKGTEVSLGALNTSGIDLGIKSVVQQLYPNNSFLAMLPYGKGTNQLKAFTTANIPNENKVHVFHLRVEMTYEEVTISDVAEIFVNVSRVFPDNVPVASAIVVNGTRKGAIVYDLSSALGTVNDLELQLNVSDKNADTFKLQDRWIVCDKDVNLNKMRSSLDSVGQLVTLPILAKQQPVLTLQIAVIANGFRTTIGEFPVSLQVADFSSLASSFYVTLSNGDFFGVNEMLSKVELKHRGDYEVPTQRQFVFNLRIVNKRYHSLETTLIGVVDVLDENDVAPTFEKKDYRFPLQSGSPPGTILGTLSVTDPDQLPTTFNYTILDNTYKDYFKIDGRTGNLVLDAFVTEGSLNSTFNFDVSVSDGFQSSPEPATVTVTISNLKQAKLGQFNRTLYGTVKEGQPPGTFVLNASTANYTEYKIVSSTDFFKIDPTTGEITTTTTLDRESLPIARVDMSVIAYPVGETCSFEVVSNISITIEDVNDNSPFFKPQANETTITEHSPIGTSVLTILAGDKDIGVNANLTFRLSRPASSYFNISRYSGVITVGNPAALDREKNDTLELLIIVTDGGDSLPPNETKSANTSLTVKLTDINDNSPVFQSSPVPVQILENQNPQFVSNLTATDGDVGLNAEIRYYLYEGGRGYFSVNNRTGEIRTTQRLDREQFQNFSLVVLAYDGGSPQRSTSIIVSVNVLDENDNAPVFEELNYFVTLNETNACSNSTTLTVSASDADSGQNASISYAIDNSLFVIDNVTGAIRCSPSGLDYENETQRHFTVTLTARDQGTPSLNNTAYIRVTVEDMNDNPPTFESNYTIITVPSSSFHRMDAPLEVVSVDDRDSGKNGQVDLSLTSNSSDGVGLIRINEKGVLRVNKTLVVPKVFEYRLSAIDRGQPPLESHATLILNVTSDNSTISFSSPDFTFNKSETNCSSSEPAIGQLTVSATGSTPQLVFSLVNPGGPFRVNNSTGQLFCTGPLDREKSDIYTIFAAVTAPSAGKSYSLITVNILDINDNPPVFRDDEASLIREVREDAKFNTTIINIVVTDNDAGQNAKITYSLVNTDLPFQIDTDTGRIFVTGTLDRETTKEYNLTVQVRDNGSPANSASTQVKVQILDVNDNTPQMNLSHPQPWSILENSNSGTELTGHVAVSDPDFGVNGTTGTDIGILNSECANVFTLESNKTTLPYTHRLRVAPSATLDFETAQTITCILQASDNNRDSGSRSSSMTMTISITDVNDNAPQFVDVPSHVNISRADPVDFVIVQALNVTDADSEPNSKVKFSFQDESKGYFFVDPNTGRISVAKLLEDLTLQSVNLIVLAENEAEPKLNSTIQITVYVSDNNTAPVFANTSQEVTVKEEDDPGRSPLFSVVAYDFENSKRVPCNCTFAIVDVTSESGANMISAFNVTSSSRADVIQVAKIDRERTGNWINIYLEATDHGMPPKSSRTTLHVKVEDVNDNRPKFQNSTYNLNITQRCQTGVVLDVPRATDADIPENGVTEYRLQLIRPIHPTMLQVNASSGEVTLDSSSMCTSDSENVLEQIVFLISASDNIGLSEPMTVFVQLFPIDNNPHPPTFSSPNYKTSLDFTAPVGHTLNIPSLSATDQDGNDIRYDIQSGNFRDLFSINNKTGQLTLQYALDDTVPPHINLMITATDLPGNFSAKFSKTATATVEVQITEQTKLCEDQATVDKLRAEAKQFIIFRGLFIGLVVVLAIAIIAAVIFLYKWRVTKSDQQHYEEMRASGESRHSYHPLADNALRQPGNLQSNTAAKKAGRSADSSGLPPRLPRRDRDQYSTPGSGEIEEIDSAGYLTPSQGQPSNETLQGAEEEYLRRRANRSPYDPGPYIDLLDTMPSGRAPSPYGTRTGIPETRTVQESPRPGGRDGQSDPYLHPTAAAPGRESDTYIHPTAIREESRPYKGLAGSSRPGGTGRESDTYLHAASDLVRGAGRGFDPYLHPTSDDHLPPAPLPHTSSFNFGFSPDYPGTMEEYNGQPTEEEDRWSFREPRVNIVQPIAADLRQDTSRDPAEQSRHQHPPARHVQNQPANSAHLPRDPRDGNRLAPMSYDVRPALRSNLSPRDAYGPTSRGDHGQLMEDY